MNIIYKLLNNEPYQLPPVTKDGEGYHHLDMEYKGEIFKDSDFSLSDLLVRYYNWVIDVRQAQEQPEN